MKTRGAQPRRPGALAPGCRASIADAPGRRTAEVYRAGAAARGLRRGPLAGPSDLLERGGGYGGGRRVYPREIPATRDRVGSDRWRRWRGRRGGRARKGEPAHSSATTATRSSITCAALIGVDPVAGEASVQPGAARPVAS